MKTKIENLSFIVLISFQFGIGTDKTYSSEAISDLKKGKYFIDKCSSRDVIPLEEYVCQPLSFQKSSQEIEKVNPLYAFKLATAYFRGQGMVPVFEDCHCRLVKL